jgi:hypothetical protein
MLFLSILSLTDKSIKILDINGLLKYTINPISVSKLSTNVNVLNILLTSNKKVISLNFTDFIDATALNKIKYQIDILLLIRNITLHSFVDKPLTYSYDKFLRPISDSDKRYYNIRW